MQLGPLKRQFRDLRNASGHDRFSLLRTVDCSKTQSKTVQVIGRRNFRFATGLNGREEFAHRAVKSTRKPGSGKLRCLNVLAAIERDLLLLQVGPCADERAFCADNDRRVTRTAGAIAVKKKLRLRCLVFDARLAEKWRPGPLPGSPCARGTDPQWALIR